MITTKAVSTIYSNSATGNDTTGDGSAGSPYKTFHKAYTEATSGDTINLTGTFDWSNADETGDSSTTGYTISKDLTIVGQGASSTIIQAATADNTADRRVFTTNSDATITFQSLSIRYGKVTGSNNGGGIRNDLGNLTLDKVWLHHNRSSNYTAGGVSNEDTLTVLNSTISNNTCYYYGGGIANDYYIENDGYLTVTNSTIAYNQQTATVAYTEGGGIHFRQGSGTITNSTIAYNTAYTTGGVGMDDTSGVLTIKNTIIANNNSNWNIDFGYRQSGYGNVTDNGNNIVGKSSNYTWTGSNDWIDQDRNGIFSLYGVGTTGSLNINSTLADNSALNDTQTLALLTDSIAIDNGQTGTNGSVSVPILDQRGASRSGDIDIGAYEFEGEFLSDYTLTYIAGANGSITGSSLQTVTEGSDGTAVTAVADDHYSFVDWSDGSTQNPRTDTSITGDVAVTANFTIDTYTLTYTAGVGGVLIGTNPQTVNYGSDGTAVTASATLGYSFSSWSDGSVVNPRTDTSISADLNVAANFVVNPVVSSTSDMTTGASTTSTETKSKDILNIVNDEAKEVKEESLLDENGNLPSYSIRIYVEEDGKPVVGARVEIHSSIQVATTDSQGYAYFSDVEPGEHEVFVSYNGKSYKDKIEVGGAKESVELTVDANFDDKLIPIWVWIVSIVILLIVIGSYLYLPAKLRNKEI